MNKNQVDKLNEIRARRIQRMDYGVPGMKWGERKEEQQRSADKTISSLKDFGKGAIFESPIDCARELSRSGFDIDDICDETVFVTNDNGDYIAVDLELDRNEGNWKISDVYES